MRLIKHYTVNGELSKAIKYHEKLMAVDESAAKELYIIYLAQVVHTKIVSINKLPMKEDAKLYHNMKLHGVLTEKTMHAWFQGEGSTSTNIKVYQLNRKLRNEFPKSNYIDSADVYIKTLSYNPF